MTTIEIQIPDDLIQVLGKEALQARIYKMVEWEKLKISAQKIQTAVVKAGLDNDKLFAEAKTEAWKEFKKRNLKGIIE